MTYDEIVCDARLAGQVERYHAWPTLRRQSVGEHTWQLLRLYWMIFGSVPPDTTTAIIWHDAPELRTGDAPFQFKASNPELKALYDAAEEEALRAMGGPADLALSDHERRRIKACDVLDMYEFGLHEVAMGNSYGGPIVSDTRTALQKIMTSLPKKDRWAIDEYVIAKYGASFY